jgi:hypothetical protein
MVAVVKPVFELDAVPATQATIKQKGEQGAGRGECH